MILLKKWLIILSAILMVCVVCWAYWQRGDSVVFLSNGSGLNIKSAKVVVCGQTNLAGAIKPGERKSIKFKASHDSHYQVSIQFSTGKELHEDIGYVTNGMIFSDEIFIKENTITSGNRSKESIH